MRSTLLIAILAFCALTSLSRSRKDSLVSEWNNARSIASRLELQNQLHHYRDTQLIQFILTTGEMSLTEEERFENDYQAARFYIRTQWDTVKSDRAMARLSTNLAYSTQENRLKYKLLVTQREGKLGNKTQRMREFQHLLDSFLEQGLDQRNANFYIQYFVDMSHYFRSSGLLDSASFSIQHALIRARETKNPVLRYKVKYELARVYNCLNQTAKALEILESTENEVKKQLVPFDQAYYFFYHGKYMLELGQSQQAQQDFSNCLSVSKQHGFDEFVGACYLNVGASFHKLGNSARAKENLSKAIDWYTLRKSVKASYALLNLGNLYRDEGDFKQAKMLYDSALNSSFRKGRASPGPVYNNLALLAHQMGDPDSALIYNELADTLISENSLNQREFLYHVREQICTKAGDYESAYHARLNMDKVKRKVDKQSALNGAIAKKLELENVQSQRALLTAKMKYSAEKTQRQKYVFVSIGLILLSGIVFLVFRQRALKDKNKAELKIATLKEQNAKAQLHALRAQINPHFMFNSLNTFQYFLRNGKTQSAMNYLEIFSGLLRDIVSQSMEDVITIKKEVSLLKRYVKIEEMRLSNQVQVEFEVPEQVLEGSLGIPPMLIQPLLENAIWHGAGRQEVGEIRVAVTVEDQLKVVITDNGPGFSLNDGRMVTSKSYGISNVQNRLINIGSIYGQSTSLTIESQKENGTTGTEQVLILPLIHL